MNNIVKFPNTRWTHKPKSFYKFVKPAKYLATFIAVTTIVGVLTAIAGPVSFIIMAIVLMIYTMIYLP